MPLSSVRFSSSSPTGIVERDHGLDAGRHRLDPVVVEGQPVDQRFVEPRLPPALQVDEVGGEDLAGPLAQQPRQRRQRRVLVGGRDPGQDQRRGPRAAADVGDGLSCDRHGRKGYAMGWAGRKPALRRMTVHLLGLRPRTCTKSPRYPGCQRVASRPAPSRPRPTSGRSGPGGSPPRRRRGGSRRPRCCACRAGGRVPRRSARRCPCRRCRRRRRPRPGRRRRRCPRRR